MDHDELLFDDIMMRTEPVRNEAARAKSAERKASKHAKDEDSKARNKAGRPTEADLTRRKAKIMEVAAGLFLQHGYAGTSLVDIAKDAGVATRTLYEHFGNKEDIFHDFMFSQDLDSRLAPPVVSTGDTLFDVLIRVAHYACQVALSERSVGMVRLMVAESKRFPDMMKNLANLALTRFRNQVTAIFADLERAGLIPASDHLESTGLFVDFILGNSPLFIYSDWAPSGVTDAMIQKKVEMFILGRFGPDIADKARQQRARLAAS